MLKRSYHLSLSPEIQRKRGYEAHRLKLKPLASSFLSFRTFFMLWLRSFLGFLLFTPLSKLMGVKLKWVQCPAHFYTTSLPPQRQAKIKSLFNTLLNGWLWILHFPNTVQQNLQYETNTSSSCSQISKLLCTHRLSGKIHHSRKVYTITSHCVTSTYLFWFVFQLKQYA